MDDIVRQAMAKWPNVPHCYGWLGLDARGGWYMRDDRVQASGPFPHSRGSLLRHVRSRTPVTQPSSTQPFSGGRNAQD